MSDRRRHGGIRHRRGGLGFAAWCLGGTLAVVATGDTLDLVQETMPPEGESVTAPAPVRGRYGAVGTRDWWIGGTAAAEFGITHLASARGGLDWFVAEDFSLGLQGDLGWAATEGDPGGWLVGVAPMLRWHFLHRDRWTVFAEAGVGVNWTTVRIPAGGTRLNFSPQAGLGVSCGLADGWRFRTTLGWYHLSNARTGSNNPGLDALSLTVGIGRRF